MKIGLLVNRPAEVHALQTTALLGAAALRRGHGLAVFGVADLTVSPDEALLARALSVAPDAAASEARLVDALAAGTPATVDLQGLDLVLVRTSPGRDTARQALHDTALDILRLADRRGVAVLNTPDGLARAATKLFTVELPADTRPRTLVSARPAELLAFVAAAPGPVVLKPLVGTQGRDVFRVEPAGDPNLAQIVEVLLRSGYAVAQDYLPEAPDGDVRVMVLGGAPLRVGGHVAAVRRAPAPGAFRSNVALGGKAHPARPTAAMLDAATRIGAILLREGIELAGLDFIGDRVVEANVFSPGGLHDAEAFFGVDYSAAIWEHLEQRVAS
ncbi:MAG: glutathione synthase [Deltaproteobacteria bacterium]|nr:glutathione synthase [Deltaproteobacteria bacterium]